MSQPRLVTIDFLATGSHQNEIPQLNSAMDCPQQALHTRSTQTCLSKIKPHMLQQLISENFQKEDQIAAFKGTKTLDLFRQHPLGFQSNGEQDKRQSALLDVQIEICEAVTINRREIVSNSEEPRGGGKQSHAVERSNFDLPMAKRLSLQRFLEKRKDRLSRVTPYMTSSKDDQEDHRTHQQEAEENKMAQEAAQVMQELERKIEE